MAPDLADLTLTDEQTAAIDSVCDWLPSALHNGRTFFRLGGLAGTGKTTILPHIVKRLGISEDHVAFAAYTGKAARVMKRKGARRSSTIHGLIYDLEESVKKKGGKQELKFVKREFLESKPVMIVVDEASMVSEEIHKDLLTFRVPVLYVGDFGQLPPVQTGGSDFNLMEEKGLDAKLSTIHRQAAGNPIIRVAMAVREGDRIPRRSECGRFMRMDRDDVPDRTLRSADQVITGKNVTRTRLNGIIRALKGFDGELPERGDRLVLLRNNYPLGVVNGQQMFCTEDAYRYDVLTARTKCVEDWAWEDYVRLELQVGKENLDIATLLSMDIPAGVEVRHLPLALRCFADPGFEETPFEFDERIMADYAYAITAHKAQGSEWSRVLLWDDGFGLGRSREDTRRRWLYTAITRASDRLVWAE
jgi:exodeoxyribonuclease-5